MSVSLPCTLIEGRPEGLTDTERLVECPFPKGIHPIPLVGMTTMSTNPVHNTVLRLDPVAYRQLEKQLPAPILGHDDNAHSAAFRLGIQHVLQKLRDGFVTGG